MLVYLHIPNMKFDIVFDIRRNYVLNIQEMSKMHLLSFSIQQFLGKSLNNHGSDSITPLFLKHD